MKDIACMQVQGYHRIVLCTPRNIRHDSRTTMVYEAPCRGIGPLDNVQFCHSLADDHYHPEYDDGTRRATPRQSVLA